MIVAIMSAMPSIYIYICTQFFVLATGSCDQFSHNHRQHPILCPQMAIKQGKKHDQPLVFGVLMGTLSSEYVSVLYIIYFNIYIQLFIHIFIYLFNYSTHTCMHIYTYIYTCMYTYINSQIHRYVQRLGIRDLEVLFTPCASRNFEKETGNAPHVTRTWLLSHESADILAWLYYRSVAFGAP